MRKAKEIKKKKNQNSERKTISKGTTVLIGLIFLYLALETILYTRLTKQLFLICENGIGTILNFIFYFKIIKLIQNKTNYKTAMFIILTLQIPPVKADSHYISFMTVNFGHPISNIDKIINVMKDGIEIICLQEISYSISKQFKFYTGHINKLGYTMFWSTDDRTKSGAIYKPGVPKYKQQLEVIKGSKVKFASTITLIKNSTIENMPLVNY